MQDSLSRLWRAVFGEPPPLADDAKLLSRVLVENLPLAPPYQPVDLRVLARRQATAAPSEGDGSEEDEKALRA